MATANQGTRPEMQGFAMESVEGVYPLGGMQQSILLRVLVRPGAGEYVEQVSWTLEGAFDADAFARAWRWVMDRHPVLRTSFFWEGLDRPLQVVRRGSALPVEELDWRGLPEAERAERLERLLAEDRLRGFDLAAAPLMRLAVVRLAEDAWHVVWSYHHLLLDGWSAALCLRDLFAAYEALCAGRTPQAGRAPRYEEYLAWAARRDEAAGEVFWRGVLAGFRGTPAPGVARPGAREGERYGLATAVLEPALVERLEGAARRHQATLNTLLQGAWGTLLAGYTGEEDVVFGAVAAGRMAEVPGVESMLGVFINTTPVRVRMRAGEPAAALLQRVQAEQLRARPHEHWPAARLQELSEVPRGRRLFETMFVFQNLPDVGVEVAEVAGQRVRDFRRASPTAGVGFALVLEVVPGDGLELHLAYDEARFDAEGARRLLGHLRVLLEAMAADLRRPADELPLLTPAERRRLLAEWNAERSLPADDPVHLLVSEQAARTPDAVAVVAGGVQLTYAELVRRADGLAGALRARGVGPEVPVAVCADRSPDLIAAVLGVLAAGGAYVPLDPAYPADRLAFMLADSDARVLVTEAALLDRLPDFAGEVVLVAPSPPGPLSPASGRKGENDTSLAPLPLAGEGLGRGLAYVIYTSGSTGTPKGVRVEHRQLLATLLAAQAELGFRPGDVMPSLASQAFDIWLFETLLPLLAGATVRLVPAGLAADVPALVQEIGDATLLHAVPALMRRIVEETAAGGAVLPLRQAFVGGDAVPAELPGRMRDAWPGAEVRVLYGPTEGTIICAAQRMDGGPAAAMNPLGRPLGNARLYVVGAAGGVVPVGVPGELCIGGASVARDYLGRPELTAERFVPDPFADARGARMYRTGDRARWLEDGSLEFLGRTDQQVKVRGFRVEPGEVEAVLALHPGVSGAVVAARGDGAGERRLVAYFTAADGRAPAADELRGWLRERLPDHMVPGAFVALESLPLTPNGKVDRRALPAPEAGAGAGHVPPRTPTEAAVAAIFGEVLGAGPVGAESDFFALGGHSLVATRVISRVREAAGVELPLAALFDAPTVAGLAARVDALRGGSDAEQAPPLVALPRDGSPLPLSFAQRRLWFLERMEPGTAAYNMPAALRVRGPLHAGALRRSFTALVERHEVLRTTFPTVGGEPVQVIGEPLPFPLEEVDLRGLGEAERDVELARRAREEAATPFDLAEGPLLRATLLRLADEDCTLLLTMHHIVSDGWSVGLLVREIRALYEAFASGGTPRLPELPVQYADYAVWQREYLRGDVLDAQVAFWREALDGAPPVLEMPTDRPRPAVAGARGASVPLALPANTTRALRELARAEGATLFMALLAGWQTLLGRYAGADDVVVGSPVAGRTRGEVESLIGFFVNTLALRADLGGDPTVAELLGQVRGTVLQAHAHQELPFDRLVEELGAPRDLAHTPLFQVMFALENEGVARTRLRIGGMEAERLPVDTGAVKFDLALAMADEGERITGVLEFRADLFEAATAQRMAEHLSVLLASMAADPQRRLSDLGWISDAERRRVLVEWNAVPRVEDARLLHQLVSERAALTPDAVAVLAGSESVTYAELEAESNRLAHHFRGRGVGPEVRVGVCLERRPELVAAVLAVLKAGGAYVPMDPSHPAERLAYVLEDSGASFVLTRDALADRLPHGGPVEVVSLDAERERIAAEPARAPAVEVDPASLAYVIYTSGSTGRPKGVRVEHRSLAATLGQAQAGFGFRADDEMPVVASQAFDIWVFEALLPLAQGGRARLVAPERVTDVEALVEEMRGATLLHTVPALMRQVVEQVAASGAELPRLRQLFVGGDAIAPELLDRMREVFPAARVHALYGPTEGTVICAAVEVDAPGHRQLVGRPLGNAALYVCDAHGAPVPAGVPGELCLGGASVARDYLGRADLTAERFVPDPFAAEPGARMYRTGDRVRWGVDGVLEFLGRIDQQVKVRGFRIEPGEVESVLAHHPAVREAAVVARADGGGDPRLVAYVVGAGGAPAAGELRAWLRERLPDYMVPSAFVAMDALPLTSTGKLDRRALPALESSAAESEFVAPRTPTEELLAGIFADVLGAAAVGAETGFFEAGGHSLLATRVMTRVRDAFGVELPLRALFEAPTPAGLAARVDALLRAGAAVQAPPLVRMPRDGSPLPLSFAQQRLWFLDRMEPGSAAYNMPAALRFRGAVDADGLRRSFTALVGRHEALRTTFPAVRGVPAQVIGPPLPFPLEEADLCGLSDAEREAELLRRAHADAVAPFDLAAGPLLRATLLRLREDESALLVGMHHIVSDGWSVGLLVREISALYQGFAGGATVSLPDLPVQYADFAAWQREHLQGEVAEAQLAFWRDKLRGAPPVLELTTDRPRPALVSARGASVSFALPTDTTRALRELARREGATLFMTLLASWQALLGRYAGTDDVVVGSAIAGRTRREVEGLIGFFVNTLALRTELSGDPTVAELLGRARETVLGAHAHQELPFERLVEEMGLARDLAHTPVFQVMFTLENEGAERTRLRIGGVEAEHLPTETGAVKFDLALAMADEGERITGAIEFRTDLFEAATAERMAEHLSVLLASMAADPQRRLSDLDWFTAADRRRVLVEWNAVPTVEDGRLLHQLVTERASATPDAVALLAGDESITYADLEAESNRLAHHLRGRGVGPEVRVGVCLERRPELVVAVLAVLKAGGAYVPMDPSHPAERLAYVLEDSGASFVLTRDALAGRLPGGPVEVASLDAERERIAAEPAQAPAVEVDPASLAYVIYTSGSTGRPKGVRVEHRSLAATLRQAQAAFGFRADDEMPVVASQAFDIWAFEALLPLTQGGRARLVAPERVTDVEALVEEMRGATLLHTVPALMRQVVEQVAASGAALPRLRQLFVGGDAIPPELLDRMREVFPAASVYALYGPTEGTVICAAVEVDAPGHRQLVGRPLGNAALYVCDAHGGAVPAGVPGELCLGGASVARDYLGRADLTAERFVPDPFEAEPGARMYRTGDRVRWGVDGVLEFLGRIDQQVKVRGFRIEPGEIESMLAHHPAVREAAVVARADGGGDPRLAAYVVGAGGVPAAGELRAWLRERLPDYMVPSSFVAMGALPLTSTGKLDRRALPAPESAGDEHGYVAPRTVTERVLAEIWSAVLGAERVGVRDDFFALGGHSLMATRLISRVREAFGVELPLRALFEAPTVAELAARVEALSGADGGRPAPPLVPVPRDGSPLPLSFAQQRLWFLDRMEPGSAAYNMPVALRIRGATDAGALRMALEGVVRRHEALRTVFRAEGGEPAQVIAGPAPFPLEVVDLASAPDPEAEMLRLAREEAVRPFDLAEGPLLRAALLRLAEQDSALLVTMHHIVSDGWSMGLLVREVSALYEGALRGERVELPELPVQYADYAAWQREHLRGETLDAQIAFWREKLKGAPPVLELPTDRPRPALVTARGASAAFALSPEASRAVRELARREGATLFMTLLAGWQALLGRYAGTGDVVVGSAIAGRTRRETEGLIGFFVNTLALRTDLGGDPTVGELLARVREGVLEAHAHQELPFERLVEELGVRRDLAHTPVFQVVFTLGEEGADDAALRLGEAVAEPLEVGTGAVKFDLVLAMSDVGGRIGGGLEYRTDLFDAETAARMLEHLAVLLESMAADPARRVSELEWIPAVERRRVVEEWNATARPYPAETVPALFAEQAARTPDAPALVVPGGAVIAYAELERRADRLAGALRRRGVGPETRVGIYMERSPELVVAMLAILKAGGAYVPLDTAYPAERLAYMAQDSAVTVVLTQERLLDRVPRGGAAVVVVDSNSDAEAIARESADAPPAGGSVAPEQLAYVIYTSGSTGRPKGAMVPHRAIVRLVVNTDYATLDAGETVLQLTPTGFDVATFEVWGALLNGARLVLAPPGVPSVPQLEELVRREGVSTLWLTSGLFHLVADERPAALAGVRQLLAGGDVLSPDHVRRTLEALPGVRLVNGYGPTENTTFTSCHTVRPEDAARASIPIGRPIANTTVYVLDAELRPVATGVPGELYTGGDGLARGYLDRPDATAEKWVPDPFAAARGGRLYRTGDRARWLADGTLEFLGRIDQQVKIRGFRIEPGEVETALHTHPAVREAAVVVRDDASGVPGERRLVAYVVAAGGEAPSGAELRAHLQGLLPEYMLPAAFVALDALPLNTNGKVDRRALPAPQGPAGREYVAPRTATEVAAAAMWAELLGVERVGLHDNFFELGGHSLLVVQLHARLQERFGDRVSLTDLFQFSTLADLARHLDRPVEAPADAHRENVERAESRRSGLARQRMARSGGRRDPS